MAQATRSSHKEKTMQQVTRRQLLQAAGFGAAALAMGHLSAKADEKTHMFELPKLPYSYDALEPYIDAETMKIHHDFHHKAYVDNLNKALAGHPDLAAKRLPELLREIRSLPESIRTAVRNNGGGDANHTMFWQIMGPKSGGSPSGELGKAIDEAFGSFDKFQAKLSQAALTRFGSGWGWLVLHQGKLAVESRPNQDSPIMAGQHPIMGIDVWEHAYYLKYRNRRADYIKAWWNVVNWDQVAHRYEQATRRS
jgi:Fe-Mn family superoxide dismutase